MSVPVLKIATPHSAEQAVLDELKQRCAAFGVDASNDELVSAGLLLLLQQTETGLEAALLQSLRADRSVVQRKVRRR